MAEVDRARLAAMLPADSRLELRSCASSIGHRHADQLPDARFVDHLEGVVGEDATLHVPGKEASRIISAHAEGGLREIVGAEREELRTRRDLIGGERGARQL